MTAVGRIDLANVRITFEVTKRGQPYVTQAYLHSDSDSFDSESPVREWVAPNALYVGFRTGGDPVHTLVVRNEGSSAIKWMRVGAQEFFLVFDLASGAAISLRAYAWEGGSYGYTAEGQFQNGRRIERTPVLSGADSPRAVSVTVTDGGARLSFQLP